MISEIHAAQSSPDTIQNITSFATIGMMMGVFYFMMIRPQRKRQLAHEKVLEKINVGDEVTTSSGIIGTVTQIDKQYLTLRTDNQSTLLMQRHAVMAILPNGTINKRNSK